MFSDVQKIDSISSAIEQHFEVPSTDPRHVKIFRLCVRYVVRQISAKDFQSELSTVLGRKLSLDFRCSLTQSVYFLRDLRAFVLKMSTKKRADFDKYIHKYSIAENDAHLLRRTYSEISRLEVETDVIKRVCNIRSLDAKLANIITEVKTFCERHVRSKLYFVLKSCNYETHDLVSELLCKAISTFYWTSIEAKSRLHTVNSIKLACKNHARNMINYFTAKKRSRLNRTGENQFTLAVVSENQLIRPASDEEVSTPFEDMYIADNTSNMMLTISVNQIQERFARAIEQGKNVALNSKKLKFVKLLMGYHDAEFTKFLKGMGINCSNDEYQDRVQPKRYIEVLSKYLRLPKIISKGFIESLRISLA